ncbi:MAG: hypothetical protein HQL40_05755 [Alphaproteobacteria bacterium]|nr:hypothetical protein [Alphaproteobacteria bacterium]
MALSLRDLVSFFVEFEKAVTQSAAPGVMEKVPREPSELLDVFHLYSGCTFIVREMDFYADFDVPFARASGGQPPELCSLVLNFGKRAEIYINGAQRPDRSPILNRCHRRFFLMKEAFHVVLRDEFVKQKRDHPDTNRPETLATLVQQLTYLPFSIVDFDSPAYPDSEKVEHAAELLALFMLYPLDVVAADRANFNNANGAAGPAIIFADTRAFAQEYLVPQRYVDLLFRWERFDELYAIYRDLRLGVFSAVVEPSIA